MYYYRTILCCQEQIYDLNKDFMCCESKGQQNDTDPDTPRCSAGDCAARVKYCLDGRPQAAKISGNTAKLQNLNGVGCRWRKSTEEKKEGLLNVWQKTNGFTVQARLIKDYSYIHGN